MNKKDMLIYISVLILSALFLFIGNRIATANLQEPERFDDGTLYVGVVTQITDRIATQAAWQQGEDIDILFDARITRGARRGDIISGRPATTRLCYGQ